MSRWLMLGGGRWAKILVRVLRGVFQHDDLLDVWTPSNHDNMRAWVQAERIPGVEVLSQEPDLRIYRGALIVNRARDHVGCALKTLAAGLPTLVEKPTALSGQQALDLVKTAENSEVLLYPALVFRHAEYLRLFAASCDSVPEMIELDWHDPVGEERWGEKKRFDATISVVDDVLPHVYSVVCQFCSGTWDLNSAEASRGGQEVACQFQIGPTKLRLHLARNAAARCRKLRVWNQGESRLLDFTTEPGTVTDEHGSRVADPDWSGRRSPLTLLLTDFYHSVTAGLPSTLKPSSDELLLMASMSEQATSLVHQGLAEWLSQGEGESVERDYATRELTAYGRI